MGKALFDPLNMFQVENQIPSRTSSSVRLLLKLLVASQAFMIGCNRADRERDIGTELFTSSEYPTSRFISSQEQSSTLFKRLTADGTGLDFTIKWDKPAEYDRVFYSQNTGGGVAIGDYDQDGLPDVYLTRPSGGNRLYRNLGNCQFEDVTSQSGLRDDEYWGTGAGFVDIDGDGDLDLYACGYACANRLYINQGNGTFIDQARQYGLDYKGASVMMAFADYDRDGDLDAYLVTAGLPPGPRQRFQVRFVDGRPEVIPELREFWQLLYLPGDRAKQIEAGQYDHLFRNDGPDGYGAHRFVDVSSDAGIDGTDLGQAATWWDYDDDGYPDLYVANDYWGPDKLYRNNQNGTFTDLAKTSLPHTPWSSMGVDVADINGDGRLDFMATDMAGSNHFRQKVGMGDMSSSGWFLEYAEPRQYSRNTIFINTGTDRFMEAAFLTGLDASDWTWTPRFDDFDNDGLIDVLITNGMTRDFTNSDLNEHAKRLTKEGSPEFFAFWRNQGFRKDRNLMFQNRGDLTFKDVSREWGFDRLGVSFGAATGDLDADGDLDIVVNNMDTSACVYRNDLQTGNSIRIVLKGTVSNHQALGSLVRVSVGGQTQVRYFTLARGWTSTSEPSIHFGLGEHDTVDRLHVRWPNGTEQEFSGLAANRLYTITEPLDGQRREEPGSPLAATMFQPADTFDRLGVTHEEEPYDDFQRQPLLPSKLSQLGPGLACADINGDGVDDFYLSGARGKSGRLILSSGDGAFASHTPPVFQRDRHCEDMGCLFFDADGDGDHDLYVVSGGVECEDGDAVLADRLYINDGSGGFGKAPSTMLPPMRDSGSVVCAADFDADGDLDLFVGGRVIPGKYPLSGRSRLLMNDAGTFKDATETLAPGLHQCGMVTGGVWSDADGDGWIDLLVTVEWGSVRYFRNAEGRLVDRTSDSGLDVFRGWWNGMTGHDLDHDGDIDYVVTNFGLNTKYHASNEHPARLYYGDFDGSGTMRLVESEYEGNKLFPVRGKSCSTGAMPFLASKFNTFESFGLAELQDIYTTECLETAHQFEANTLETGLMINDGNARFAFRPLPRLAQIAPSFGCAVADVNVDGHPDIYLVQNFYSPQRETGRMDGGVSLLLLGDGTNSFRAVFPDESGLLVPGDAKSLVVTDFDDDARPDFLVGVNDAPVKAWIANSNVTEPSFCVKLRGKKGNSSAIGARVQVIRASGVTDTQEVFAGSGYLSQSTASLFFGISDPREIERITVTWPNRISTVHKVNQFTLVVEQPN